MLRLEGSPTGHNPPMADPPRTWTLLGPDGPYESPTPGTLGGHRRSRIYGRLDCPVALRTIARGGYVAHRVFFADEETAVSAGYRPCGVCRREEYAQWKA
jgi:Metal binding domain of Ada